MQVSEFAFTYGLNSGFFDYNPPKSEIWIKEAPIIAERLRTINHGIVAPTSAGKTVMALLSIVIDPKRTLFLVPLRRLTNRHQSLFSALCSSWQTRCITGETKELNRVWDDIDDRIVFATAHVVVSELNNKPWLLHNFDLIVFDEMHNAASMMSPYAQVAMLADQQNIRRLALSASPGNEEEQIEQVKLNCKLDELVRVQISVPEPIVSVIWSEEALCYTQGKQVDVENFVRGQQVRLSDKFAELSVNLPMGKRASLDPAKFLSRRSFNKLRKELHDIPDHRVKFLLISVFEEFAAWSHIFELATQESFAAIQGYVDNTLAGKSAKYAQRLLSDFHLHQFLRMIQPLVHPKMELLLTVMESLQARDKQAIIFVGNKETAKECFWHLSAAGFTCDVLLGGGSMTHDEQEVVLERMENREIQCIIATTVLREGFNLSVDVIINMTLPTSPIDLIQRSGRAGRNCYPAEIIYIATKLERAKLIGVQKKVRRLSAIEFQNGSTIAERIAPKHKQKDRYKRIDQVGLFDDNSDLIQ